MQYSCFIAANTHSRESFTSHYVLLLIMNSAIEEKLHIQLSHITVRIMSVVTCWFHKLYKTVCKGAGVD